MCSTGLSDAVGRLNRPLCCDACLFPSLYRASVSAVVCVLAGDETVVVKPYTRHNSIQLHDKPGGAAWPTAIIFCLLSVQTLRVPLCVRAREKKRVSLPQSASTLCSVCNVKLHWGACGSRTDNEAGHVALFSTADDVFGGNMM